MTATIKTVLALLAASAVLGLGVYLYRRFMGRDDETLAQAAEELAKRDLARARQDAEVARIAAEAEARKRIQAEQDAAKGRKNGTLTDTLNRARADTKP